MQAPVPQSVLSLVFQHPAGEQNQSPPERRKQGSVALQAFPQDPQLSASCWLAQTPSQQIEPSP
jgi:hypothetical protein